MRSRVVYHLFWRDMKEILIKDSNAMYLLIKN